MNEELQKQFAGFAWHLLNARESAREALASEEMTAELAARGIRRADIETLAESADEIARGFYNTGKPE